MSNFVIMFNL